MYKICTYCVSKAHLGVSKASLCIYRVLNFFRCYLAVFKVHPAFFAYDEPETLVLMQV